MLVEPHYIQLLILEDDRGHREVVLDQTLYSIGSDPKSDIRLFSLFVAQCHATLVQLLSEDGAAYYRIVDGRLNRRPSPNGLLIIPKLF